MMTTAWPAGFSQLASFLAATQILADDGTTNGYATGTQINTFLSSSSQTLTNKAFDTAGTGNVLKINGTQVSDITGTGKVVLDTSPSLTTPALGVATATSINKVAITAPAASATLTIANAKTLTVSNTLTFTGTDGSSVAFGAGGTVAYTNVATLSSLTSIGTIATGVWQGTAVGVAYGGTGQSSYTDGQLLIGNTATGLLSKTTLTAGTNITITNGNGTITIAASGGGGSPAGSGTEIQFKSGSSFGAMSGTAWDDTNRSLAITGATVTTSKPILDATQTWNAGGVTFTGLKFNVTDTTSAAGSLLVDLQVASSSKFAVRKDGQISTQGLFLFATTSGTTGLFNASQTAGGAGNPSQATALVTSFVTCYTGTGTRGGMLGRLFNGGSVELGSTGQIGIASGSDAANSDTMLTRGGAAATWQFGAADAASPVAQTLKFQDVVGGTSNIAGANATVNLPAGTGTGNGGDLIFNSAKAGTTGSSKNTQAEAFRIKGTGPAVVFSGGGVTVANLPAAVQGGWAFVTDANATTRGSTVAGGGSNKLPVYSDGSLWIIA